MRFHLLIFAALLAFAPVALAQEAERFELMDVFELEYASDPQISPDGEHVIYRRNRMDVMADRARSDLWIVDYDGGNHRPLVADASSPRWSPDGERLAYVTTDEHDKAQLFVRYFDTGASVALTQLPASPGGLGWSPDGEQIAFTMFVEGEAESLISLPAPPDGAAWADRPTYTESVRYRSDGSGYTEPGFRQVFVVSAEGGTPRQVTNGPYNHGGSPAWTPDGQALILSANRSSDWEYDPRESDLYRLDLDTEALTRLTDRDGPDASPAVAPDGRIAYLGFDDRRQGYQLTRLYVADADGSNPRLVTGGLDRSVQRPTWSADGTGVFVQYDDEGDTKIALVALDGTVTNLADHLGGTSLGRPYGGGSFSIASNGRFAFTLVAPHHPADLAVGQRGARTARLTRLNDDLFEHAPLGKVEELWTESSADGQRIHGWIVKPPDFDPDRRYPLILEIHGGPFANYGPRFSAEVQLMAAAGYVVLYTNPRGSTSYGEAFGNLIHHAYPSQDYDDLMSAVDAAIGQGYVDPDQLFVTGGSGGGVLTAWIVGHTDRFRAAVVAKPVINWTSFVLTADAYPFFSQYWFPALPWEDPEGYWARSPLAYVGNVTTPTMLLTGEEDFRTPISESEQYYQALKLRRVPTALVRVPGAAHGIASRPSRLMAKVAYILGWFERYRGVE
ncbi:MAG: S9 family peptidase [Bacteroidota bacterium]